MLASLFKNGQKEPKRKISAAKKKIGKIEKEKAKLTGPQVAFVNRIGRRVWSPELYDSEHSVLKKRAKNTEAHTHGCKQASKPIRLFSPSCYFFVFTIFKLLSQAFFRKRLVFPTQSPALRIGRFSLNFPLASTESTRSPLAHSYGEPHLT